MTMNKDAFHTVFHSEFQGTFKNTFFTELFQATETLNLQGSKLHTC